MPFSADSHCIVEWDEPDHPRNVVPLKDVCAPENEACVTVGCLCAVKVREGKKTNIYKAKVLGIGKLANWLMELSVCII